MLGIVECHIDGPMLEVLTEVSDIPHQVVCNEDGESSSKLMDCEGPSLSNSHFVVVSDPFQVRLLDDYSYRFGETSQAIRAYPKTVRKVIMAQARCNIAT